MNENVRQKEGKALRPWCEDEFITKVELPGIRQDQDWLWDPDAGSGISGRRESAQAQDLNGLQGIRPKKGPWLVEVRPDEELPPDFCVRPRRILAPTALDETSAVAVDYASALAWRFGSELALLYAFEGSDYAQSSNREAELRTCCSALKLRNLKTRVFLEPGPTGERVKDVANALDADLIVTSCDYHRRFLNYLTHAPTGTLRLQGVACPVVLVDDAAVMAQ